jgi:hypothetical protein
MLARSAVAVLAAALFYFCGSNGFSLESVPQSFEGPIADS